MIARQALASPDVAAAPPRLEDAGLTPGSVWEQASVTGDFTGQQGGGVEVNACRIEQARFTACDLERLDVVDSVISDCDLSGTVLRAASLLRVEFRHCRMASVDLAESRLRDVLFVDCKLESANFRMSRGGRVTIEDSELADADFYEAQIDHAQILRCNLRAAEFTGSKLRGAQLHGSSLDGIRGARYLSGVVIDPTQVVPLAVPLLAELGIEVDTGTDG